MTLQRPALSDPPSLRLPDVGAAAEIEDRPRVPPDESVSPDESDLEVWRGLLIGTAISLFGLWGPLGLIAWWWFR